jgi:toxin ParE1/3/4
MSAHRRKIVLAPRASDDLDDLLLYTEQEWGKRQSDAYLRALWTGMRRLADHPGLGRERDRQYPGIRGFLVEHHIVIYQTTDTELRVARILHERRDIDAELIKTAL